MKHSFYIISIVFILFGCTKTQPRRPINPKPSTTIFKTNIETSKKLIESENKKIADYIAKDTTKTYINSNNGFWYTYINKVDTDTITPKVGDEVVLNYNVSDLNDEIIYSKEDLGLKNYKVDKEDFISGLQRGIKLMKEGETITFVIPFYNAFGISGDGNKIGLKQTIKSTVTLIKLNKSN
ncbi:gliding motility-associated peptidyl-prolyl isomerase GldI [Polaribacter sp.]|uniref:gliding motility-associated peptidyl-prolyl isomerase GldI n=1 Tax=Polaribacter sp. TaxID=1920175 RepID=UPI003F6B3D71